MMQDKERLILGALLVNPDILNHLKINERFFSKSDDRKIFNEIKSGNTSYPLIAESFPIKKQDEITLYLTKLPEGVHKIPRGELQKIINKVLIKRLENQIVRLINSGVKDGEYNHNEIKKFYKEIEKLQNNEEGLLKKPGIFIGSLEQLKSREVPEDEPLIENLVFRGSLTGVGGVKGSHKSFFVNQLAFDYCAGYPFLKFRTHGLGRVLLIQQEVSLNHNKLRLNRMQEAGNYDTGGRFFPITTTGSQLKLTRDKDLSQIKAWIEKYEPDILIFDPLSSFNEAEENTSRDMSKIVNIFNQLKSEFNLGLVFTHHFSSKKDPDHPDAPTEAGGWFRGHTVLPDSADALICLHRLPGQRENVSLALNFEDYNLVQIQLRNGKWPERFAIEFNSQTFLLGESNVWQELGKKIIPGEILEIVEDNGGEMTRKDLIEILKEKASYSIIHKAIKEALKQGLSKDRLTGKKGNPVVYRVKS